MADKKGKGIDPIETRMAEALGEAIGTEAGLFGASLMPDALKKISNRGRLTESIILVLSALPALRDVPRNGLEGFLRGLFRYAQDQKDALDGMDEADQRSVLKRQADAELAKLRGQAGKPAKSAGNSFEALHSMSDDEFEGFEKMLMGLDDAALDAFLTTFLAGEVTDKTMVVLARFTDPRLQQKFRDRFVKVAAPKEESKPKGAGAIVGDAAKQIKEGIAAAKDALGIKPEPLDPAKEADEKKKREKEEEKQKKLGEQLKYKGKPPKGFWGFFRRLAGE
jgi:hypothetical protein